MQPPTPPRCAKLTVGRSATSCRLTVLLLTGLLSVGSGLSELRTAIAATNAPSTRQTMLEQRDQAALLAQQNRRRGGNAGALPSNPFPPPLANLIRQDLARRINVAPGKLRVTLAEPRGIGHP